MTKKIIYTILGLAFGAGLTVFAATSSTILTGTSGSFGVGTSTSPIYSGVANDLNKAGTYLTVSPGPNAMGVLELGANATTADAVIGGVHFINEANYTSTTTGILGKGVAGIAAMIITGDNNVNRDSGGSLIFNTKPSGGTLNLTNPTLILTHIGEMAYGTPASEPTVSTCGTGPTRYGNNTRGRVYVGTGVVTSCTLTFGDPKDYNPICAVTQETGTAVTLTASTTRTAMVVTSTATMAGDAFVYSCDSYQ